MVVSEREREGTTEGNDGRRQSGGRTSSARAVSLVECKLQQLGTLSAWRLTLTRRYSQGWSRSQLILSNPSDSMDSPAWSRVLRRLQGRPELHPLDFEALSGTIACL